MTAAQRYRWLGLLAAGALVASACSSGSTAPTVVLTPEQVFTLQTACFDAGLFYDTSGRCYSDAALTTPAAAPTASQPSTTAAPGTPTKPSAPTTAGNTPTPPAQGSNSTVATTQPPASQTLEPTASPFYGDVFLASGFAPDPYDLPMIDTGGSIDVLAELSTTAVGQCAGFAGSAPDYIVTFSDANGGYNGTSSIPFDIFFQADNLGDDTTLVVSDPQSDWYCNDDWDPGSTNPLISFPNPYYGSYSIWVGTYTPGISIPGTLWLTESGYIPAN